MNFVLFLSPIMKYFVIFLVLISVVSFTANNSVYGLSCDGTNITQSFAESDVVFAGQVLSKEYVPSERSSANGRTDALTQFSVTEKFKGISQETISIISSEWMWGFNFTKNLEYVVFAYDDGQNLRHQTCTPTSLLEDAELEQIRQVVYDHILSPLKQFKSGVSFDKIVCRDGLELIGKMPHVHPKCVKPESVEKLTMRGWATTDKTLNLTNPIGYVVTKNNTDFELLYFLKGATLESIIHDVDANSVHVSLSESMGGQMVISIPRDLIDAKIRKDIDDLFFVLIDGVEIMYGEKITEDERIITVWFPKGAQDIEIIGTFWI